MLCVEHLVHTAPLLPASCFGCESAACVPGWLTTLYVVSLAPIWLASYMSVHTLSSALLEGSFLVYYQATILLGSEPGRQLAVT